MSTPTAELEPIPLPEAPAQVRLAPADWVRANLLYSPVGVVLTVVFGAFTLWVLWSVARFVFGSGQWEIVRRNLSLFMAGRFPRDEVWRLWAALVSSALLLGVAAGARMERTRGGARRWWPPALFVVVVTTLVRSIGPILGIAGVVAAALAGREIGRRIARRSSRWPLVLAAVGLASAFALLLRAGDEGVDRWGGLLLTMLLAIAGIVVSFPVGVLLALGRRSTLPAVRAVSVVYIEVFRGVPLVTVLFMGDLLLGFFLPPGTERPGVVTRAVVAIVLFTSAYIAEIVRGGLQSVPRGQIEAALALGLPYTRTTVFIVLPQALRAVIPAIVGQFISLFKDTSLVATIGLFELLAVAQTVTKQPDFLGKGLQAETLVFISFIYWVGAYWLSRASQRLELRLGVGVR